MIKNTAGTSVGAAVISATTGAAFVGAVTVYVTGDAGTQAIGSVGGGACTAEGNGLYTYRPAQAETNYDSIDFTFVGSGAIPANVHIDTLTPAAAAALASSGDGPVSRTVTDLVTTAFKRIRVLATGEVLAPEILDDGFNRLNAMIDGWALERLTVYTITRTTWTIVSGQASYTVGSSAQVNMVRPASPNELERCAFQDTAQTPVLEYSLGRVLSEDQYQNLPQKTYQSTYPTAFYYNPTVPTGILKLFPIPTSATLQGVIYAPTPLARFITKADIISLSPGYEWAITENLAVLLAPEFNGQLTQALVQSATDAKNKIKTSNTRMMDLDTGAAAGMFGGVGGPSNIYTGQ